MFWLYFPILCTKYILSDSRGTLAAPIGPKPSIGPSMERKKVNKKKWEKKKITTKIMATNVINSPLLKHRPTGVPFARAKKEKKLNEEKRFI